MVLGRAGDDLGGRGAAGVDQHDDRKAVRGVARPGIIAFDVALLAAALGDDLAMLQEGVGQADRLVEQAAGVGAKVEDVAQRSEEHTSELQSLMRISYAVFCLKKKKKLYKNIHNEDRHET